MVFEVPELNAVGEAGRHPDGGCSFRAVQLVGLPACGHTTEHGGRTQMVRQHGIRRRRWKIDV